MAAVTATTTATTAATAYQRSRVLSSPPRPSSRAPPARRARIDCVCLHTRGTHSVAACGVAAHDQVPCAIHEATLAQLQRHRHRALMLHALLARSAWSARRASIADVRLPRACCLPRDEHVHEPMASWRLAAERRTSEVSLPILCALCEPTADSCVRPHRWSHPGNPRVLRLSTASLWHVQAFACCHSRCALFLLLTEAHSVWGALLLGTRHLSTALCSVLLLEQLRVGAPLLVHPPSSACPSSRCPVRWFVPFRCRRKKS